MRLLDTAFLLRIFYVPPGEYTTDDNLLLDSAMGEPAKPLLQRQLCNIAYNTGIETLLEEYSSLLPIVLH